MEKSELKQEIRKIQEEIKSIQKDKNWKNPCSYEEAVGLLSKITPDMISVFSWLLHDLDKKLDSKWWELNAKDNKYPHIPEEWLELSAEEIIEKINERYSYKKDGRTLYHRWVEYDYPVGSQHGKVWFREYSNSGHHNLCWTDKGEPLKDLVCFFYESFCRDCQFVNNFWD